MGSAVWKCIYLDFSYILAVKVRTATVLGQNELRSNVFAQLFSSEENKKQTNNQTNKKTGSCLCRATCFVAFRLNVQTRLNKAPIFVVLAGFHPSLLHEEKLSWYLNVPASFRSCYMSNIGPFNLQSFLPAQRWQCSSVEPASSPLADTEEYLG